MHRPIDLHDSTLLALWVVIWSYPNTHPEVQRDTKNFYEAAKRDLKRIYGITMEDIKEDMEREYILKDHPGKWCLWDNWNDRGSNDWRKDYV